MGIFEEFKQNRADIIECILTVNYNKKALNSGLPTNDEQKAAICNSIRRLVAECMEV